MFVTEFKNGNYVQDIFIIYLLSMISEIMISKRDRLSRVPFKLVVTRYTRRSLN